MTITLRPEQEQVVGEAIRSGLITTADEVVNVGVEAIRQRLASREATDGILSESQRDIDAAAERLLKFGEMYHFSLDGMTIKELVNEGRR